MQLPILIATLAYFLFALASIMDKHIVSNTSMSPLSYAFYSGIPQIFYVAMIPVIGMLFPQFIFHFPSIGIFLWAVLDGIIFTMALLVLYKATAVGEISRISSMIGILVPIFTLILSAAFLKETLDSNQSVAFVFFVLGGLLISSKVDNKKFSYAQGTSYAVLAGFLFAAYYVIMSFLFKNSGFVEAFIIIQLGGFIGALMLLIPSKNRKSILKIKDDKPKKKMKTYGALTFFADKSLSAIGSFLLNFAISIGSVTMINSLQSIQYIFVFIFSLALTKKLPHFFNEETHRKVLLQKGAALAFTAVGLRLIS